MIRLTVFPPTVLVSILPSGGAACGTPSGARACSTSPSARSPSLTMAISTMAPTGTLSTQRCTGKRPSGDLGSGLKGGFSGEVIREIFG